MENNLYSEFAKYYAAITNDRDFEGQLKYIMNVFPQDLHCSTFLELFAGQSHHSLEASKLGNVNVWAIDSSSEMKYLALKRGFPTEENYIIGDLPKALSLIPENLKFDCIICLYHGLSNLPKLDAYSLLKNVKELLTANGKLFLEIHDIYYIMEYIADQKIQYTTVALNAKKSIKYAWPSGKIRWDSLSFKAEVPVRIIVEERNVIQDFISTDYIYSFEDIIFMSNVLGYKCKVLSDVDAKNLFGISLLIELSL